MSERITDTSRPRPITSITAHYHRDRTTRARRERDVMLTMIDIEDIDERGAMMRAQNCYRVMRECFCARERSGVMRYARCRGEPERYARCVLRDARAKGVR